jgi:hypothetical protein
MEERPNAEDVCLINMATGTTKHLKITKDSIETELKSYQHKPYKCLFEYIWNSFDAAATKVNISYRVPKQGIGGVSDIVVEDNGDGWDLVNGKNTNTFLASTKSQDSHKQKTLPRGKFGRGRYTFIWIAEQIEIYSLNNKATLTHETKFTVESTNYNKKGTKVVFEGPTEQFSQALKEKSELLQHLLLEFGWFLYQNNDYEITVNGESLDVGKNIRNTHKFTTTDFSKETQEALTGRKLSIEVVLWNNKPSEWSNYYFLNNEGEELYKKSTELNKKRDDFWHSVYVTSDLFDSANTDVDEDEVIETLALDPKQENTKKTKRRVLNELKVLLVELRKPILREQSKSLLNTFKQDNILPNLPEYGIYDNESYEELLETVYVISPSVFVGKSDTERKFMCATFASLLSTQDGDLIQKIIGQLQELSDEEKEDLSAILEKSSLSNIIKTIKEVDHRLNVVDDLSVMLSDHEKETLEVEHVQKLLDENFWLFGEQFRLFSSTEGALHKKLREYAKEILGIDPKEITSKSRKELDLFLTKTETSQGLQRNVVVELKRMSVKLREEHEYAQIKRYCNEILAQAICNGTNQCWEFYLIGKDYDAGIAGLITNAASRGESNRGLVHWDKEGRVKIYVRKWSDVLEVEWGEKMKYLKEKLQMQLSDKTTGTPTKLVKERLKARVT